MASFRKISPYRFARLACVKHAASVHPEPGSNSLVKSSPWVRINSWLILFPFLLLFWFVYSRNRSEFSQIQGLPIKPFLLEFSGSYILFNLWLSRFVVSVGLSAATHLVYHKFFALSTIFFQIFYFLFWEIEAPHLTVEFTITFHFLIVKGFVSFF